MAIVIPSKKIYHKKNEKIISNQIKRIDFNVTKVEKKFNDNRSVNQLEINDFSKFDKTIYTTDSKYAFDKTFGGTKYLYATVPYYRVMANYKKIPTIKIPKNTIEREIQELLFFDRGGAIDSSGEPIVVKITYKKKWGIADAIITYGKMEFSNGYISDSYIADAKIKEVQNNYTNSQDSVGLLPDVKTSYTHTYEAHTNAPTLSVLISVENIPNSIYTRFAELDDSYIITLENELLCEYEVVEINHNDYYYNADGLSANNLPQSKSIQGTCEKYIPKQLSITSYGKTIDIELKEETIITGQENSQKSIIIERNELTQYTNYYKNEYFFIEKEEYYADLLGWNIVDLYKNGKETAVIRCSIGDYYDGSGTKVIDITDPAKPMKFSIGDEVVPMVYGADGKDYPMSLYKDGTQKVFTVLGTNIYYDGAVWQELTLQEIAKDGSSVGVNLYANTSNGELRAIYYEENKSEIDFYIEDESLYATSNDGTASKLQLIDGMVVLT